MTHLPVDLKPHHSTGLCPPLRWIVLLFLQKCNWPDLAKRARGCMIRDVSRSPGRPHQRNRTRFELLIKHSWSTHLNIPPKSDAILTG